MMNKSARYLRNLFYGEEKGFCRENVARCTSTFDEALNIMEKELIQLRGKIGAETSFRN